MFIFWYPEIKDVSCIKCFKESNQKRYYQTLNNIIPHLEITGEEQIVKRGIGSDISPHSRIKIDKARRYAHRRTKVQMEKDKRSVKILQFQKFRLERYIGRWHPELWREWFHYLDLHEYLMLAMSTVAKVTEETQCSKSEWSKVEEFSHGQQRTSYW